MLIPRNSSNARRVISPPLAHSLNPCPPKTNTAHNVRSNGWHFELQCRSSTYPVPNPAHDMTEPAACAICRLGVSGCCAIYPTPNVIRPPREESIQCRLPMNLCISHPSTSLGNHDEPFKAPVPEPAFRHPARLLLHCLRRLITTPACRRPSRFPTRPAFYSPSRIRPGSSDQS